MDNGSSPIASTPDGDIIFGHHLIVTDTGSAMGRGVYAARPFSKGELVEVAHVVELQGPWDALPEPIRQRVFSWKLLTGAKAKYALPMGFGTIYNHSDSPNLRFEGDRFNQVMRYVATRDIADNEQLFIDYNQAVDGGDGEDKDWFKVNGITKAVI